MDLSYTTYGLIALFVFGIAYYSITSKKRLALRQLEKEYRELLKSDKYKVKGQHDN